MSRSANRELLERTKRYWVKLEREEKQKAIKEWREFQSWRASKERDKSKRKNKKQEGRAMIF